MVWISLFPDVLTSLIGFRGQQPPKTDWVLQKEEFDPAVFQLCAENQKVQEFPSLNVWTHDLDKKFAKP